MHEYSVVQSLLDLCQSNAEANGCTKVGKVVVKIGVMSGIEPDLLATAFDTFKENTLCHNATFEMVNQNLVIQCKECGIQSTLDDKNYKCPQCNSFELDVIDGEDAYLMSLEME